MTDCELAFRDRLGKVMGKYCPNDATLNILSFYLFREAVDTLRDSGKSVEEILSDIQPNTDIEIPAFTKAVKDVASFTSQNLVMVAIKKAYIDLKNSVPLVQRDSSPGVAASGVQIPPKSTTSAPVQTVFSQNVAEFDIDLSSVPKVDISKLRADVKKPVRREDYASNVFSGDIHIDVDEVNMRVPKSSTVVKSGAPDDAEELPEFDASSYTEGVSYTGVPEINIDLDY